MPLRVAILTLSGCHFPQRRCALGARLIGARGPGQIKAKPHDEMDGRRAASIGFPTLVERLRGRVSRGFRRDGLQVAREARGARRGDPRCPDIIARVRTGEDRTSLYNEITDKIIAELEAGRVPWVQPWGTAAARRLWRCRKRVDRPQYSGINVLILWGAVIEHGFLRTELAYISPGAVAWRSRPQGRTRHDRRLCRSLRARRRKAARRARPVRKRRCIPFLKRFTVFNTDQCDGLPREIATTAPPPPPGLIEPEVEYLIKATGIDFRIGGNRAFYAPAEDYVQVPPPQAYFEPINWHRTALHELGACQRPSITPQPRPVGRSFGTKKYAFEELVAEISSAFGCASLGIVPTVRHADYIGSWLEVLREDNRAIVRAASQASKVADYLLGSCRKRLST